jgi:hypothetical protein
MESVELANGESVGVAEVWEWPDTFDGMTAKDLLAVQNAIEGKSARFSEQAGEQWAGCMQTIERFFMLRESCTMIEVLSLPNQIRRDIKRISKRFYGF